jgi:hypothetical protein
LKVSDQLLLCHCFVTDAAPELAVRAVEVLGRVQELVEGQRLLAKLVVVLAFESHVLGVQHIEHLLVDSSLVTRGPLQRWMGLRVDLATRQLMRAEVIASAAHLFEILLPELL